MTPVAAKSPVAGRNEDEFSLTYFWEKKKKSHESVKLLSSGIFSGSWVALVYPV